MFIPSGLNLSTRRSSRHNSFFALPFITLLFLLAGMTNSARAATFTVPAGGDLQGAINSAQPGDVIILEAGASFTGSFILPSKPATGWITIQSSALAQLPEGERVTPAQSALMPKLISPGQGLSALKTAAGA
ncbi:MAG: hypothetical protein H0U54_00405, partial [Acidobacteria bacterium]|nr:hypothetical protein [Acidobacteriota bacterium]